MPYAEYLRDRLERAGKVTLSATVLLRELRARGYDGGITQRKEHLRAMRPPTELEPVVRFETEPGKQLQIDFVVFRRGNFPLRLPPNWDIRDTLASNSPTTSEPKR